MIKGPADFEARFFVSRETCARLQRYYDLLVRWNPRINLVSPASLQTAWHRHFADSAQLWRFRPEGASHWLDLGAGAGFPGLVVAAIAKEQTPDMKLTLVESDARKAAFLTSAAAAMELSTRIEIRRIEDLPPQRAEVVSARALAPLCRLLPFLEKHRAPHGIGLFPKGASVHKEIREAENGWRFAYKLHPSMTQSDAAIVEVGAIERA